MNPAEAHCVLAIPPVQLGREFASVLTNDEFYLLMLLEPAQADTTAADSAAAASLHLAECVVPPLTRARWRRRPIRIGSKGDSCCNGRYRLSISISVACKLPPQLTGEG
jgi:hypothetical protein